MVALSKTKQITYNANLVQNQSRILVSRLYDATKLLYLTWKSYNNIHWSRYEIRETDMRQKTATFSSPNYFDLTTGVYVVLIASPYHANFGGVILSVDYDEETGLYDYKCQDFSRWYQSKIYLQATKRPLHRLLQHLITKGGIPFTRAPKKSELKMYKESLSGLRPAKYYDQKLAGSTISFNPMTQKVSIRAKGKSRIELIRDLVYGTGAYIDVYFGNNGVLQVVPYHKKDLFESGLHLTTQEIASRKFNFDTTNIITGVDILDTGDKLKQYTAKDLTNVNLSAFFGNLYSYIDNSSTSTAKNKTGSKKQSTTTVNKDNPYGTKNKEVWVNMDTSGGNDSSYLNRVCELLSKNGWKVHNMGVGPNIHTLPEYFGQCHDGIWWTIDNGMDPGTIRHLGYDSWCAGHIMRNGGRAVFACMMDNTKKYWIEKGCDNWYDLHEAHDDGYSSGDTYLRYPAGYMAWCGLPFMTAKNYDASGMVAQFLKGGVSQEALKMSNWKNRKGNYYVQSGWSSNY